MDVLRYVDKGLVALIERRIHSYLVSLSVLVNQSSERAGGRCGVVCFPKFQSLVLRKLEEMAMRT